MELLLTIFFLLISLIICLILVVLNAYKQNLRKIYKEVNQYEKRNNKSFKS